MDVTNTLCRRVSAQRGTEGQEEHAQETRQNEEKQDCIGKINTDAKRRTHRSARDNETTFDCALGP